ncbi:MAG: UvrD-helicase domain-containing protein [Gordonia sp. (in: high G+C Gram-positive bacteria)]|uniref:UvrD-helicase domain-containing protein n=1 Tax=Gordonia sp. (in: high G+C Gram-positive bacteria) TaxID=84139 RepID=UPI0039E42745
MTETPAPETTEEFDPTAPLPTGTLVLEASAGTGKTYAIVSLAVRYIADGVPVDRLLMATFSNAASDELRDRTRRRIGEYAAALASPPAADDDEVLTALRAGDAETVQMRRSRLVDALTGFDAATVATTHTFCNRMLAALGFLGGRDQQYPIVENADDLVADLARDVYIARFARDTTDAPGLGPAQTIAIRAVADRAATLTPGPDDGDERSQIRYGFAQAAREQIALRKLWARIRTYDDLQQSLHAIVTDPVVGEAARARIRDRFSVVLIDEFQDTDPQQWDIVRLCFHERLPLILVGDPKQSIYAFRGAEVRSYLAATAEANERRRLGVNRRSDGALVGALDRLLQGATFGDARIAFTPVRAVRAGSRLDSAPPLRIRAFLMKDYGDDADVPKVAVARPTVITDVADDIAALLGSTTTLDDGDGGRRVQPGDIAILVRANKTVEPLQNELAARGIASVVRSGTSIFKTAAARHWWYVLQAAEQPSRTTQVRLAALTPLIGLSAAELDAGGDHLVGELAGRFAELGRVFADGGFASMSARLFDESDTVARLLGAPGGERLLTDLMQLSDLCNTRASGHSAGIASLASWLGEQVGDESRLRHGGAQTRRLDRDTHAVQIMTVHASKGLEFPIVYVPFGWDGAADYEPETFLFHDRVTGQRCLDVGGGQAPGHGRREALSRDEDAGEQLRLLYVALTRAASQVVLWWTPSTTTEAGPLHRLLFTSGERTGNGQTVPTTVALPATDYEAVRRLRALAEPDSGIVVEPAGYEGSPVHRPVVEVTEPVPELAAATFGRDIDQQWRRTSYSAIVADAHARAHAASLVQTGSEPEDGLVADEPAEMPGEPAAEPAAVDGTPSLMNGLPFGAAFGTLVHEVLEHVDTSATDPVAEVTARTCEGAARLGADVDVDRLAAALVGVLTTPLGFGDLWSIRPADRLAELDFELALAAPGLTLDAVGDLLARHLPADDPLHEYADVVRTVSDDRFRGFLTGSIDSVLRRPDGRFTVVDYKTNRLHPGEVTVQDFDTEAMAAEMMSSHYPLQALFYSVALHRYLRWRIADYEPDRHLGPVQYHFVRGMAGPDTPRGYGVFEWHPPAALVADLSDLLAGKGGA